MQWIVFGILAAIVISGVRRMAREVSTAPNEPSRNAPFTATPEQRATNKPAVDVQDTVQCSKCNAYMVKNAASCGRVDCPFGK